MSISKEELIKLIVNLIYFKTITKDQESVKKAFAFIKDYLKKSNLFVKEFQKNGFLSLAASNSYIDFSKKYDIIFHGHIDVVAASEKDQFKPKIKDGKIFGRGALDMKGGLGVLIYLMKKLPKTDKKIILLITSDEEIGGENGTNYFFKDLGLRGNFFLTAEGERDYLLKVKQKGVVMFKLKAKTKGEHSAYQWLSENAIIKIFNCYQKIKKLFPKKKSKDHWYSTINLGLIKGGTAVNSIPNEAEASFDIRFCEPWQSSDAIINKLKKIIQKERLNFELIYKTEMMATDIKNFYVNNLNNVVKKELNIKKDLYFKNHGTNDARFANIVGIPSVGFGPIGDNYHAPSEFVYIESLVKYFNILEKFVLL
jgi:succinyl-diaminopimelate desuccinylase